MVPLQDGLDNGTSSGWSNGTNGTPSGWSNGTTLNNKMHVIQIQNVY